MKSCCSPYFCGLRCGRWRLRDGYLRQHCYSCRRLRGVRWCNRSSGDVRRAMRSCCRDGAIRDAIRSGPSRNSKSRNGDPRGRSCTSRGCTRDRTMPSRCTRTDRASPSHTMNHTTRYCTMRMSGARENTSCSNSWDPTRDCTRGYPIRSNLHRLCSL